MSEQLKTVKQVYEELNVKEVPTSSETKHIFARAVDQWGSELLDRVIAKIQDNKILSSKTLVIEFSSVIEEIRKEINN